MKRKRQEGFLLYEVVLSLVIISAVFGLILSIGNMILNYAKTDEQIQKDFHISSILRSAESYCLKNKTGRGTYQENLDGYTYTITEDCNLVQNNLYRVLVRICDKDENCKQEVTYVSQ